MGEDVIFGGDDDENQENLEEHQQEPEKEETENNDSNSNKKPDEHFKSGSVHLYIWENSDGLNNFKFQRYYTRDDGETYNESQYFRARDLPHIANLVRKVLTLGIQDKGGEE